MENQQNKKLHPQGDGVFGHGEWGMGHGEEVTNAQCPMPNAPSDGATIPLHPQGDGVSRRFQ
ncbi:hypothetical protein [Nostoc sp.]|uniref:hypothetical protein n=1 Tax=Nostoc sp. TaxID=1180 RepID=UPI002FFA9034